MFDTVEHDFRCGTAFRALSAISLTYDANSDVKYRDNQPVAIVI